jgi:F0F1-type ATP synthase assembly protein I
VSQPKPEKKKSRNRDKDNFRPNDFYKYSGMAIKMAVVIAAGVYGGIALDTRIDSKTPWFTLLFSILSVAAAIYIVIKDTKE